MTIDVQVSTDSVFTSCLQYGYKGRSHYGRVAVLISIIMKPADLKSLFLKSMVHPHSKQDFSVMCWRTKWKMSSELQKNELWIVVKQLQEHLPKPFLLPL